MCRSEQGPHSDFGTRTSLTAEQEPGLEDGVAGRLDAVAVAGWWGPTVMAVFSPF